MSASHSLTSCSVFRVPLVKMDSLRLGFQQLRRGHGGAGELLGQRIGLGLPCRQRSLLQCADQVGLGADGQRRQSVDAFIGEDLFAAGRP